MRRAKLNEANGLDAAKDLIVEQNLGQLWSVFVEFGKSSLAYCSLLKGRLSHQYCGRFWERYNWIRETFLKHRISSNLSILNIGVFENGRRSPI